MAIIITGNELTVEKVVKVARYNEKVELHPDALKRIEKCREMLEEKIQAHEIMYGVNTGIGEFSEVVLKDDQVKQFQKYLIYNHAAGIGDPAPKEYVRGAMLGRINVHAHGNSGIRPVITQTLIEMLNKGVTPRVCQKGSVGACGDLAPMSQIALVLMGEGEAYYQGKVMSGKEAMDKAGIPIPGLKARDGLGTINGSNVLTAMSAAYARSQVEIELNGVGDNPVFFPDKKLQLSGANFQGSPVSLPMDMAGVSITMVSVMSERRMNRLNNPALSVGLPPFLTKGAGMMSGLMLSQYTADMLIVEQRILSAPASIQSIPAAADQEDFVSMGMNTAIKNFQIMDNAYGVLGIEFMAAAQALDFRDFRFGKGVTKAKEVVRRHVKFLDEDRPLYHDHTTMKELVKSGEILEQVEKVVGSLE